MEAGWISGSREGAVERELRGYRQKSQVQQWRRKLLPEEGVREERAVWLGPRCMGLLQGLEGANQK